MNSSAASDFSRGLELALRLLAGRDHTAAEVRRKLAAKKVPDDTVAAVLVRLDELGYLDDRGFALRWAEAAVASGRGFGPRIRYELMKRGVAGEIVSEVVATVSETAEEQVLIARVVSTRFPLFDPKAADKREMRRVVHYLQRRGFSGDAIWGFFRDGRADADHEIR